MWLQWCIHTCKGTIKLPNTAGAGAAVNNTNKKAIFKNCGPLTKQNKWNLHNETKLHKQNK